MTYLPLFFILLFVIILCCGFYEVISVKSMVKINEITPTPKQHQKPNVDLLNENQFNLMKMNPNRWNYNNADFAPYIDGSYKQVTNNYVPDFKFNNNNNNNNNLKTSAVYDTKINAWRNQSDSNSFLVQCKKE